MFFFLLNECIIFSYKKTASPFFGLAVFGFLRVNVGLTKPFIKGAVKLLQNIIDIMLNSRFGRKVIFFIHCLKI